MKVVCLVGSPRIGGNTDLLADSFLEVVKQSGTEVKKYHLNSLKYRGCQGCLGCKKTKETCVLQDDLTQVLEDVRNCDVLVLGTPVYYGEVTSQLKAFIDRTYCYLTPNFMSNPNPSRLKPGKKLVFLMVQGHPDAEQFKDIHPRYETFLQWYGFEKSYLVRACGAVEKGDITKLSALQEAQTLAKKILSH